MSKLCDAIFRFNLINKNKEQLADWRIIKAAALQVSESPAIPQPPQGEIYSNAICDYCIKNKTDDCTLEVSQECFMGRKLYNILVQTKMFDPGNLCPDCIHIFGSTCCGGCEELRAKVIRCVYPKGCGSRENERCMLAEPCEKYVAKKEDENEKT